MSLELYEKRRYKIKIMFFLYELIKGCLSKAEVSFKGSVREKWKGVLAYGEK